MTKVLMLGGTGIISSDITALATRNDDVELYLLNRGTTRRLFDDDVNVIQADVNDADDVLGKLEGMTFDVVADFITYDVESLERKLEIFRDRCGQYVFISSVAAYRLPTDGRMVTEADTGIGNGLWTYGINKASCEWRLAEERERSGLNYTIVRPAYTYNDIRILHPYTINHWFSWTMARRILDDKPYVLHDDGQQLCTAMHASDFARAFIGLWGNPAAMNEDFHITSSEYLTWKRVAELTGAALGKEPLFCFVPSEKLYFEFGEAAGEKIMATAAHSIFDNAKIRSAVPGFDCEIQFKEGVKRTIQSYLDHPERQIIDEKWDRNFDRVAEKWGGSESDDMKGMKTVCECGSL